MPQSKQTKTSFRGTLIKQGFNDDMYSVDNQMFRIFQKQITDSPIEIPLTAYYLW